MPNSGPFPSKDADLNNYAQRGNTYLNTNKVRLVINAADLAALTASITQWNITYPLSQNPDTCTVAITKSKNTLRKQIETLLRKIYGDIPKSVLTADDRATLNLKAHAKPTPAPVPDSVPAVELHGGSGNQVIVHYKQEVGKHGSSHHTAKPDKVSRMELCYKTGDPVPANPDGCNKTVSIGKVPHKLNFDTSDSGKRLYAFARWVNTRNQPGPWTALLQILIP